MMRDLFDDIQKESKPETRKLARRGDPATSYEAAAAIVPKLKELQLKVYEEHQRNPNGLTDLELEEKFNNHGSTYRTRRAELTELGLLEDSGRRRLQKGSNRIVWVLKYKQEE